MSLSENIQQEMKKAMLAKDQASLRGLRAIKSAILIAQTEKGAAKELSPEQEMQLLQKLIKQRKDSLEIFEKENREELAQKEREEITVIQKFLPEQMGEEEIRKVVQDIISSTGATSIKDMGKVMGAATKRLSGKADNKTISGIVKSMLH